MQHVLLLICYDLALNLCTSTFNIKKFYVLHTEYIFVGSRQKQRWIIQYSIVHHNVNSHFCTRTNPEHQHGYF
jgi:hypothetical protein